MKKITVQIDIEEYNRLIEKEKILEEGYYCGFADYDSDYKPYFKVIAVCRDEAFSLMTDKIDRLKVRLHQKRWYQFVELKE